MAEKPGTAESAPTRTEAQINGKNAVGWATPRTLLIVILALGAYRLIAPWATDFSLFYDQIQYYYWSLHPDWGYFSKPPVVAWAIWATTALFGDSETAINLAGVLLYSATAYLLFLLGRDLYDSKTGVWAGIAFVCLPIVGFNSLLVSTDAPLLFFWTLSLWLFRLACRHGNWRWWLLMGVSFGFGLLSKYSMGVLAVGMLAYLLADPRQRRWIRTPKPWLAALVASAVFAPNLGWNAQHDFISFGHTAEISQIDRELFHPDRFAEFFLTQFAVFGPVFMALFVYLATLRRSYRSDAARFLLFPGLAMLAVIGATALTSRANMNWAAPAFTSLTILVAHWLSSGQRVRLFSIALAINLIGLSVFTHYHWLATQVGVELSRNKTPHFRVLGWRDLGAQLAVDRARYPNAELASNSRKLLGYLSYYGGDRLMRIRYVDAQQNNAVPSNHYALKAPISAAEGETFLLVTESPASADLLARFASVEDLGTRRVQVFSDLVRQVHVYHAAGLRAGLQGGPGKL